MRSSICRIPVAILALGALLSAEAAAQIQVSYLQLSPTVKAVLYSPAPGSASRVAVVNMHEDGTGSLISRAPSW